MGFQTYIFCSKVPSKCRKCRFRDPNFKIFSGGHAPGPPYNFVVTMASPSLKFWLRYWSWPAFFRSSFHFTSSVCLCVGHKMKTCTQISDSGFRGKINVVNPGDSAKRASPPIQSGFSHVNARWNPALLLGLALPRGAGPPPNKHLFSWQSIY